MGTVAVFPVRANNTEMVWGLTGPALKKALTGGFVRVAPSATNPHQPFTISYVTGLEKNLSTGVYEVVGKREDGSSIVVLKGGKLARTSTVWRDASHDAGAYGTSLLGALIPGRKFPFPKSLFAVEDCLRLLTANKPEAIVLDFFSGSGTTAHAVMRLNRQDDGRRQCISVTNNEVAADEHKTLREQGLRPGDPDWERLGICEHITKPRVEAAITGKTPEGEPIRGEYKFTDEFPMAEGFEENAEFFTLTYESPVAISHNLAFERIAPLLWMRAGSEGRRIEALPAAGWDIADTYGLLTDLDEAVPFCAGIAQAERIRIAFIVTNDDSRFQAVVRRLPDRVEAVRLHESYLLNFRFTNGD
jgi:adenine-specific DNA-methyltransferase